MSSGYLANNISVAVFGMVLAAAFCEISWTKQKRLIMAGSMAVILMFQGIVYFWISPDMIQYIYPLITHLPLTVVLCVLTKKFLWPTVAVLTAYLCCQPRRWLALLIVAVFQGGPVMQNMAELALTLPILLIVLRLIAPSVRSVSYYAVSVQCQFGLVPMLYYGFDYLTRIYTNLLSEGVMVAVEFMPFVCSVAYLVFVFYISSVERAKGQLEQTKYSLNMQVGQSIREIEALRGSQQKARLYRHDLRHHMQYISTCIENGRTEQAQGYIREVCSEIEANQIVDFCENEAANLIFSAFVERAKANDIPIRIRAEIPQDISISESNLCVLLSNALENALHACLRQKEKGLCAVIEVSAYEKNRKIFLQIINSSDADIIFRNEVPVTDVPGHGMGVRSICAIVEQYGGIYDFSVRDGQFILRVSL